MSVAYTVEFSVRSDQMERFMGLLTGVLDTMRAEPTFLNATLHVDPEDPTHLLLHETWRDHDDVVAVQLRRPYRREWHAALPELLRAERKIAVWTPLRADLAPSRSKGSTSSKCREPFRTGALPTSTSEMYVRDGPEAPARWSGPLRADRLRLLI